MTYHAKLDKFEGPLDLLLKLIEEQKLNIAEVSLASVADQYLEYLSQKERITLENLADFLTVASKLILIKSKALLPNLEFSEEEEKEIVDLERQLAEFKKFKDISTALGRMAESGRISFSREKFLGTQLFFYPPENINVFDLKKFFAQVLDNIPVLEKLEEEMVREVITLEQKIEHLQNFLRKKIETSFSDLVSGAENKVDVIVSFLAMLEMVKQKIINVEQNSLFQDIKIGIKNETGA
ncbi:MAG: segregation/condensation protein A [bacterium]|nr:segregation/condensation protein A [bacterium]